MLNLYSVEIFQFEDLNFVCENHTAYLLNSASRRSKLLGHISNPHHKIQLTLGETYLTSKMELVAFRFFNQGVVNDLAWQAEP
jgi:hypothetical protein